jgi:hypothetical protein
MVIVGGFGIDLETGEIEESKIKSIRNRILETPLYMYLGSLKSFGISCEG